MSDTSKEQKSIFHLEVLLLRRVYTEVDNCRKLEVSLLKVRGIKELAHKRFKQL